MKDVEAMESEWGHGGPGGPDGGGGGVLPAGGGGHRGRAGGTAVRLRRPLLAPSGMGRPWRDLWTAW